ncbi:MAG: nucleotidyltransferase family protein [Clostridia bacterium]|nr:nucleotidyltransferase family protein [Clostridia bacterium]
MMTVGIVAEYNLFHNGHAYQIEKIRERFGEDCAIIAVMSGNYTERAELAILDKWQRAKAAVLSGVNLVLELPFPYSASSAEFFASAAVAILDKLGVVDVISFGSECGNAALLSEAAKNMLTDEYKKELDRLQSNSSLAALGYAKICAMAYEHVFGCRAPESSSNNILALEYIKAILNRNSRIDIHTILRDGGGYNEENVVSSDRQSATAIRKLILEDIHSAEEYVPKAAFDVYLDSYNKRLLPTVQDKLDAAVISSFRLSSPKADVDIHDAAGGLYNRLVSKSREATSIPSLIELCATKKYTKARIKRAIWYSYFGVTSSDVRPEPEYTQVLAMDIIGQELLKKIKKTGKITLITKPSDIPAKDAVVRQKLLCDKADEVYQLAKPEPAPPSYAYKSSPFVKV